MGEVVIEVSALRKVYRARFGREVTALDGIDLQIRRGELFGLLGPNGAGKTTTVKTLLGLTFPTAGSARVLGFDAADPRSRLKVGYLPEGHRFPGYLTPRQTLSIFGRMSGLDQAAINARMMPLLERLRIGQWVDVRIKKFSKGMVQRLGLAAALIHDPEILFLDEPTDGVDPVGRREIRDLLQEEAKQGRTVLLNSHLLSEIELTCDRVAVLRGGKVAAHGSVEELTRRETRFRMDVTPIDENLVAAVRESGAAVERQNGSLLLTIRDLDHLNALIDRARSEGRLISELSMMRSSLEDVFVDLVRTSENSSEGVQ